ncbi:MAG: tRNA adenosine(34) deaminase TadA [Xanthomonadales bacterium]|nr:tRNA adenosine(34) deaminase TadA [Gammaproteobacteria bacterium]NNE04975.1 tRNA adenosine(34) deaminase TadA [Xanthomonadales bacterium]NNL94318.1 tRNA adenosine(34) deaminase TadA [Xanthomonadales bacterium]
MGTQLTENDHRWMQQAIELARRAEAQGEVPVGALVIINDEVAGRGWNRNISDHDPAAHAEMIALREAGRQAGNHRLPGATVYVTLEPCVMCAGAMIHARIERLVFGAFDPKTGAAGGRFDVLGDSRHNHRVAVTGGCEERASSELLKSFFKARR